MMRRIMRGRRLLIAALTASLLAGGLSGCDGASPDTVRTQQAQADYGDVADAVAAAVPRVVTVRDLRHSSNGLGQALRFGIVTDSAEPFTADELDAVVKAVWGALPWEPSTIRITAGADTADGHEVVDLRAAAAELDDLGVTSEGTGGVSLTDMSARYGPWAPPE